MNHVKIAAIILIISAGLAGSYFIVKNSAPATNGKENISLLSETFQLPQKPIQWIEELKGFVNKQQEELKNSATSTSVPVDNSSNLTKFVASSLFERMKNLDQKSQNPFEGQDFDPNDPQSQQLIQETLVSIQDSTTFFNPSVEDKDLKISQDNSIEAKSKYFSETAQIILKNFNESSINFQKALESFTNNLDVSGIGQIADAYSKILDGFLNTQVPSDYLDLHKRYIILLKKAKETYLGLADYNSDPIKASLSMQLVPKIAEAELEIKQEYYQKSLNLGL